MIEHVKPKTSIQQLFSDARQQQKYLNVCAPMVRYSKLEFRKLVRSYNVDLTFTPMIMADSFCQSEKARKNEFTTDTSDTPLIAQFASKNVNDFVCASELIAPYVDGVDLNCGCPQTWAVSDGYGCALLKNPELIRDMISTVRRRLTNEYSVSVKVRYLKGDSDQNSVDLCRKLEHCGATFLTVHCRTPSQKTSTPATYERLAVIKSALQIPVIANGDARSKADADRIYALTRCDGVMSARGILANPCMFMCDEVGEVDDITSVECVQRWCDIMRRGETNAINFRCFHHHLTFMTEKMMPKHRRIVFNNLDSIAQTLQFLSEEFDVRIDGDLEGVRLPTIDCHYDEQICRQYKENEANVKLEQQKQLYDADLSDGKFYQEALEDLDTTNLFGDD